MLLPQTKNSATYLILSYDVAVIQWIMCLKNRMTTFNNTVLCVYVTSLTTSVLAMGFVLEMFILKAIKSHFKGSYDNQNLTLVVMSYEIYELAEVSFHKFHMKLPFM